MDRRYNAGLYLRLSVEDGQNPKKRNDNPFKSESTSIENQRDILTGYVRLRGWDVAKIYIDDGFTGGNFDRPAFQEMVRDAEAGLIDLILVKDLSRFGRSHIEVDHYVEDVFPALGVRFIALMDNIDSEGGADILPFRSLLNNYYLKDISRKIKSVIHAKAKAGEYVGAVAPYGYKKHSDNCGRLVVDSYAADVVRRIFEMRLQRMGYCKIAAALNVDGILPPRVYCYASEGKPNPFTTAAVWSDTTIKKILCSEVYLGHSVKLKKRSFSHKHKACVSRPEDEWARVENTHEAIISQDVWDAVQGVDLKNYDPTKRKAPTVSLFSELLYCADCGSTMAGGFTTTNRKSGVVKIRTYTCRLHRRTGGSKCSWHTISEPVLIEIVRQDMQSQLERASVDEGKVVNEIQKRLSSISLEKAKNEHRQLSARLEDLDAQAASLYEDRLGGAINLNTFMRLSAVLEAARTEAQVKYESLSKNLEDAEQQIFDINGWIKGIRSYLALDEPDFDTLHELIDRIEVDEAEGKGKKRRQAVKIVYRFVGFMG